MIYDSTDVTRCHMILGKADITSTASDFTTDARELMLC